MILRKLENFIDFQFTQLFFQNKKDLAMKLWGMIENMVADPGESFGLKFIPSQCEIFRDLYPNRIVSFRSYPKKSFIPNQSELIIRMNPINPN